MDRVRYGCMTTIKQKYGSGNCYIQLVIMMTPVP